MPLINYRDEIYFLKIFKYYKASVYNHRFVLPNHIPSVLASQKKIHTGFSVWIFLMRRRRDSNPRYPERYASLANLWFQPLTHFSFGERKAKKYSYISQYRKENHSKYFLSPCAFRLKPLQ